jgi:hypothetical protein
MTISIKPTASGSTIEQDGSTILTVDGSGNISIANDLSVTGTAPIPDALSTASGSAPSYSARAWVNFNGTGTVAITESGNVSSIVDTGTGQYTVNFATAMPDADYVMSASSGNITGLTTSGRSHPRNGAWTASTAYFRNVLSSTSAAHDDTYIGLIFIR